jgi:predicted NACHT family NTPase
VEKRLKAGEAAFYLDGLDEIFDGPTRGSVIEEIAAFAGRYSQAPVIVTSRIVGYEAERLGSMGFTHATLEDFDDKRVLEFLAKWHDTAEDDAKERARLQGHLERALRESRAVRELAGNPLLLTMMAILNRNQDLPRDRVELYAQASRVLLHEWDASRSLAVDTLRPAGKGRTVARTRWRHAAGRRGPRRQPDRESPAARSLPDVLEESRRARSVPHGNFADKAVD